MVVGLFKGLLALIVVDDPFNPLLFLQERKDAHGVDPILAAVQGRESYLHGDIPAHGVEVIRWSVVDLAFMVIDPPVISQRVDERAAVAIGEHDHPGQRRAIWVAGKGFHNLLNIVHAHGIIVVHERDILARGLGQEHASLLPDAQLAVVGDVQDLHILRADLLVKGGTESIKRLLAFVQ